MNNCRLSEYSTSKASRCSPVCEPGSHFLSGRACVLCTAGRYANGGNLNSDCSACPSGFVNNEPGSLICAACSSGRYANVTGSTSCESCSRGTFQGATGQSSCSYCAIGKFTNSTGATRQGTFFALNLYSFFNTYVSTLFLCLSAVQIVPLDPEPMRRERPNVTNAKLASISRHPARANASSVNPASIAMMRGFRAVFNAKRGMLPTALV